jgi:hypothetical protein
MGSGVWSMHFIGMLSFHLPVPVSVRSDAQNARQNKRLTGSEMIEWE